MHFINLSVSLFLYLLIGSDVVDAFYAVKGTFSGINSGTGERPSRREIRDLRNDNMQFSLYVQALTAFMDDSETNQLSYFQIAGIHGRPFYTWDGNAQAPGTNRVGYCPHGSAMFMPWHRPYLALFEQVLTDHAKRIARQYNSAAWTNAADQLRIPYIQWDVPPYELPDFLGTSTIRITRPNGQADVANVLASYRFRRQPYASNVFPRDDLSTASRTRRRPAFPDGPSNPGEANAILNAQGPGITQQIYTIFSRSRDYNTMSTDATGGASFENPHGWFHVTVGGQGHMTAIEYSAFDPLFMMHHCNVDRLLSLWQFANPDANMQPTTDGPGNWWTPPGGNINAQTGLVPFHGSDGRTLYTAEKIKYPSKFGYSYAADVRDWEFTGNGWKERRAAAATARINQLYNTRGRSAKRSTRGEKMERATAPHEWTAAISAPMDAFEGKAFTVSLFLGSKPDNVKEWPLKTLGGLYVLSRPLLPGAPSMRAHNEITLTDAMSAAGIDTTNVNASRNYIDTQLHWGVTLTDGTVIDNDDFKALLNITIEDELVQLPTVETELPKFFDKVVHTDIVAEILNRR